MKKLPIIWSRLCLILIFVFCVAAFFRFFIFTSSLIPSYIGITAIALALFIKFKILKCPNCGLIGGIPQWSKHKKVYCSRCGEPFNYD